MRTNAGSVVGTVVLYVRLVPALKLRLEAEAVAHQRSLNAEVVARLVRSLEVVERRPDGC